MEESPNCQCTFCCTRNCGYIDRQGRLIQGSSPAPCSLSDPRRVCGSHRRVRGRHPRRLGGHDRPRRGEHVARAHFAFFVNAPEAGERIALFVDIDGVTSDPEEGDFFSSDVVLLRRHRPQRSRAQDVRQRALLPAAQTARADHADRHGPGPQTGDFLTVTVPTADLTALGVGSSLEHRGPLVHHSGHGPRVDEDANVGGLPWSSSHGALQHHTRGWMCTRRRRGRRLAGVAGNGQVAGELGRAC